jgi:ech hydrogenase subunit D
MIEEQKIIQVEASALVAKVQEYKDNGFRLVQIGVTKLADKLEINYSFDKDYKFENLRVTQPAAEPKLPSITGVYWGAFLYENEIHDLFGVDISGIAVDFKGGLYRTAVKHAFNPEKK